MTTIAPHEFPRGRTGPWLRRDLLASIVVFLVALPLCMGIAIASGAPVASGLITAIVGGLIIGTIGGCPLQVSGPAAGLTVIVYEVTQTYGLEMLGLAVVVAGGFQTLAALLRLGQWFRAVSPAVIRGMLAGIGVLIFASQFHVMVDDQPRGSGIENLLAIPAAVWKSFDAPEFEERAAWPSRRESLRTVGELHREQVHLQEQIAERVPHDLKSADGAASEGIDLSDLLTEQQVITTRLAAVVMHLEQSEKRLTDSDKSRQIRAAADVAMGKSQQALAVIAKNDFEDANRSQAESVAATSALLGRLKHHHLAAQLGLATIGLILAWEAFASRKLRLLPSPLVAVVVATSVAAALSLPVLLVEVPDYLWHELHFPTWVILREAPWTALIQQGLLIAAVASAETLLCATAVDLMHNGRRTRYDQELFAHGLGNITCGLFGALPMTGVIVRSATNVRAGAQTRLSAILHAVWLLIFVSLLAGLLRWIPTASLAAILVYTGYKLFDVRALKELWQFGRAEAVVYLITMGTIVCTDLLKGVLVGIGLAAVKLLYTFSRLSVQWTAASNQRQGVLSLGGAATFIGLPRLASALERVPPATEVHIEIDELEFIDHACLELLINWGRQHESNEGTLVVDWASLRDRCRAHGIVRRGHVLPGAPETTPAPDKPPTPGDGMHPEG